MKLTALTPFILSLAMLLQVNKGHCQPDSWELMPFVDDSEVWTSGTVNVLYESQNLEKLIYGGRLNVYEDETIQYTHFLYEFNGSEWSPLDIEVEESFHPAEVTYISDYLDGIVYVLNYTENWDQSDWNQLQDVVYYNGISHETLFTFDSNKGWYHGSVDDDSFYIAGIFDENETNEIDIIKYSDGAVEQAFMTLPNIEFAISIKAFLKFQDNWFIGGHGFQFNGEPTSNLHMFDGTAWSPLVDTEGNGFEGSLEVLTLYQDKLAIGLQRFGVSGYAPHEGRGNGVLFWDGQYWSGPQLMSAPGFSESDGASVKDLEVVGDDLFAIGSFWQADGVPMKHLAKWNGSRWCGLQTQDWELPAMKIGTFNGQIVHTHNDWGFSNASYIHDGTTFSPCTVPMNVEETMTTAVSIYPNPASHTVFFEADQAVTYVEVYDLQGRKVIQEALNTNSLDIRQLTPGIYLVSAYFNHQQSPVVHKLLVE